MTRRTAPSPEMERRLPTAGTTRRNFGMSFEPRSWNWVLPADIAFFSRRRRWNTWFRTTGRRTANGDRAPRRPAEIDSSRSRRVLLQSWHHKIWRVAVRAEDQWRQRLHCRNRLHNGQSGLGAEGRGRRVRLGQQAAGLVLGWKV